MGIALAIIYSFIILSGYVVQIRKNYLQESTKGLAFFFFFNAFVAVTMRMSAVGLIIRDTKNPTSIAVGIAELGIWAGLLTITLQILWYRYHKKYRAEATLREAVRNDWMRLCASIKNKFRRRS